MRRLVALLVLVAVAAAAPAGARQAPPAKPATGKHKPVKHKPAKHKPKKKRHKKKKPVAAKPVVAAAPVVDTPVVPLPVATTPDIPVVAPGTSAPDVPAAPAAPAEPLSHVLGVTEKEFTLLLSRTTVAAGDVAIEVFNRGEDPHDLRLDAAGGGLVFQWDELASLEHVPATTVTLTPGTYRLYCTLPDHAGYGMDKQITVAAG